MASVTDWLFASPDKLKQIPNGTPQQQGLHNNIINQANNMSGQGGGYNLARQHNQNLLGQGPEAYQQFANPYLQQFQEQMLPQIAERFAGGGALSSSGFGQAVGGAASGLQSQLAQLFSQLQQQAAQSETNQFNNLSQTGLNYQPFSYQQEEGSMGFLRPLLAALGGSTGSPLASAAAGGISSLFKNSGGGNGTRGLGAYPQNQSNFQLPNFLGR